LVKQIQTGRFGQNLLGHGLSRLPNKGVERNQAMSCRALQEIDLFAIPETNRDTYWKVFSFWS
jgi:hypothetical protein